jgi:hypothetical protein
MLDIKNHNNFFKSLDDNFFWILFSDTSKFVNDFKLNFHYYGIDKPTIIFFLTYVRYAKINLIIESGIGPGFSTFYLHKFSRKFNIKVFSIEGHGLNRAFWEIPEKEDYFNLVRGNGIYEIPKIIKENSSEKIAILLDGPKRELAICLSYAIFNFSKKVEFILLDDLEKDKPYFKFLLKNNVVIFDEVLKRYLPYRKEKLTKIKEYYKERIDNEKKNLQYSKKDALFCLRGIFFPKKKYFIFSLRNILLQPIIFYVFFIFQFYNLLKFYMKFVYKFNIFFFKRKP